MTGSPAQGLAVVAAVIRRGRDAREDAAYLVGRRPARKRHGGLWEFPGGKIRDGEDAFAAARRELAEELGLEAVRAGATLFTVRDPGSPFVLSFVEIEARGSPVPHEHTELRWATTLDLARLALAPADREFVRACLLR